MTVVFLLQLFSPLAILLGLLWLPPRNWLGWVALVLSGLLVLLVSARVGMWMFPPWWVPWAASAALLLLAMASLVRNPPVQPLPSRGWGWLNLVLLVAVGAFAVVLGVRALRAATPPPHLPVVELTFPLVGGTYLVVSGGTDDQVILWDVASGQQIGMPVLGHRNWVRAGVFSRDGTKLICAATPLSRI